VIARCTNLPVELRNGNGVGGGRIVGWLPIVGFCLFSHDSYANSVWPRLRRKQRSLGRRAM